MKNYVLITPIMNEASNLSKLKETIFNQTLKPTLWTIVDSGSVDCSFNIACELFSNYDWIKVIRQKKFFDLGYSHKNFAQAINEGYEYSQKFCDHKRLEYNFIGKTDATPILKKNYFESLVKEMELNSNLAITCGEQVLKYNGKSYQITSIAGTHPTAFNDIRLYRRDFFEDVKGYPIFYSPDVILLIKAKNMGRDLKIVHETNFIKPRLGGSKDGIWKGYFLKGRGMYCLGYHPFLMVLNALYFSFKFYPHYQGIPLIYGYLTNFIKNEEKIDDEKVREQFGTKRIKEIYKKNRLFKKR